jgi:hypothetical protein
MTTTVETMVENAKAQGTLDVLNCGEGHLSLKFDKDKPEEVEKARKCVEDMLKRGYSIFVDTPGGLLRVETFDPATDEYIVSDGPEKKKRVPAAKTKATAVGATAGG